MDDKPDYKQVMILGIHVYVLSDRRRTIRRQKRTKVHLLLRNYSLSSKNYGGKKIQECLLVQKHGDKIQEYLKDIIYLCTHLHACSVCFSM